MSVPWLRTQSLTHRFTIQRLQYARHAFRPKRHRVFKRCPTIESRSFAMQPAVILTRGLQGRVDLWEICCDPLLPCGEPEPGALSFLPELPRKTKQL
jgi:hypothetical protein